MKVKIKNLLIKLLISSFAFPVCGIAFSAAPQNNNTALFITIVATETEQLSAISRYASLKDKFDELSVISSNDCTNLKPGLVLYVANKYQNKADADKALVQAKSIVADSYIRECQIKPGSLLDNNLTFIHESIFKLPEDTISWRFEDTRSEISHLNEQISFIIERKYNGDINNEVEGRQSSLYMLDNITNRKTLILDQCWDFAESTKKDNLIAFQCVTGSGGNHYIHSAYTYDTNTHKVIYSKEFCQKPEIIDKTHLRCQEESIDANGELTLSPREFILK